MYRYKYYMYIYIYIHYRERDRYEEFTRLARDQAGSNYLKLP